MISIGVRRVYLKEMLLLIITKWISGMWIPVDDGRPWGEDTKYRQDKYEAMRVVRKASRRGQLL